ncbi:sulfate/molybdate ABC transporter ATP-binding protein [Fibrella forsythiae]|uniref:ABC transporter ATP-binding protein n=1 Tax=Fibrella forsythiae TaxID=2817061 RepID=A0ABS3JDR1_9BACT|nr:ABC transporter ATP-binding protein [Fibrella forsythiae]MBO0947596.1 ABC transporter ATP-binding protein [Fibrella forsythiae]
MIDLTVTFPRLFTEGPGNLQLAVSLTSGSLTAVVGPSGSGKTTILRVLAGLETPSQGRIVVDDQVWLDHEQRINLPPQQRSIGYVFQDTALFPNLTVRENIAYATTRGQRTQVDELLESAGLASFASIRPAQLSGGQRQRVALARALVRRPKLLLLDEPFSALDDDATDQLRQLLRSLHRTWGTTTILVSHHKADVQALADRVIQLSQGRILTDQSQLNQATLTTPSQVIRQIWFDQAQQQWVIDTDTIQLRSVNADWSLLQAGMTVDLTWYG